MSALRGVRRALRLGMTERELDDELAFHFAQTVEELEERGMTRAEAEAEARRRFGDERHWRRELERIDRSLAARVRWRERWEAVRGGVGYAIRRIARAPGFTLAVVLTFGLGIGANATMFGILDRLLLQPPAHVAEPERVVRLGVEQFVPFLGERDTEMYLTYLDYQDFTRAESLAGVAAYANRALTLGQGEGARRAEGKLVTGNYFSLLGVRPAVGRFFGAAEDREGAEGVAVISHGFWQREFGGDRGVLGRTVDFGYGPYTIVGVAPRGFTGADLEAVDVWLPLVPTQLAMRGTRWRESRGYWWLQLVGRLAPGAEERTVAAEATALHRQGRSEQIEAGDYDEAARVMTLPLVTARGPQASGESLVARWLAGISLIVLLIACANVANLLLARSVRQRREVGIRLALGSSRARVLGQVLAESLLLALLGGVAALLLTYWGGTFLRATLLPDVVWPEAVGGRVAGFVAAVAVLAGLIAGVLPALQGTRPDLVETLKAGARGASAPTSRLRGALTVLQAALSVVLLVGAGLFVRSLDRVREADLGLNPEGVLVVRPVFDRALSEERLADFTFRAEERLSRLPAVTHASPVSTVPFFTIWTVPLRVPGLDSIPRLPGGGPYANAVGEDYFSMLDLRVLRGRGFTRADAEGAPPVVVVSELMARTLWPGEEALGRCLVIGEGEEGGEPPCSEVVGVVEASRRLDVVGENEAMQFYVPVRQGIPGERAPESLMLRVAGDPAAAVPAVQRELLALEPGLRFADVIPLQERIDPEARSWQLGATMFSVFGLLALVVAGVGLYSVLAFSVAQRTAELGIRAALGATRSRLISLVLRQALVMASAGILVGLLVAVLAGPRLEPLLFQVSPHDPVVLGGVVGVLLLVAVLAGMLPAWRATRVAPSEALRAD